MTTYACTDAPADASSFARVTEFDDLLGRDVTASMELSCIPKAGTTTGPAGDERAAAYGGAPCSIQASMVASWPPPSEPPGGIESPLPL